ncbi:hypothetical protein P152DRAFT_287594 [Eremomyces bilateralis CBS 781.70]|uniref:Lanthionine synthetase C-like protein n=1 Tax=Eremomyces bilateralis CBS 781.70 TaxID=1392243 RepID=A0A6G1G6D2_9PEZI|nr:uncharacterized protein P152DRAFT_287594 [Eremomyces bilateralis CBS 781.70]KAF1813655.1 hypothetical protein P152DRAFT_287594 [Eremomyces bilateralis CBS 781.70]
MPQPPQPGEPTSTPRPPRPRFFRNSSPPTSRTPHKQLFASLHRLTTLHPPSSIPPSGGLYSGALGVAHLLALLHPLHPSLRLDDHSLASWSAAYLHRAEEHMKDFPGPSPRCCGVRDDILVVLALGAAGTQDTALVEELVRYAAVACDPDAENEWLNGRAGYLYLLRLVRVSFPNNAEVASLINGAATEVIDAILEAPRPWTWRRKAYVGAAHGAMGIIVQIVLTDPTRAGEVEADLGALLSYQFESGNWPSSIPVGRDRLVQFCHGAAGMATSLVSIREHFPALQERIDGAVKRGRECILERGLLTKEPCLCHGISGNALALEDEGLEHFLSYTTGHEMKGMERDGMMERSEEPWGLFGGEAGRAWAWAVVDSGLERRVLGYNDI